jgi:hypothetical protein
VCVCYKIFPQGADVNSQVSRKNFHEGVIDVVGGTEVLTTQEIDAWFDQEKEAAVGATPPTQPRSPPAALEKRPSMVNMRTVLRDARDNK